MKDILTILGGIRVEEIKGKGELQNLECANKNMMYHFFQPFYLKAMQLQ